MKRNQGGFTLVEMMVTIVVGSLVTLAATTVLLLGLRINNRSTQTVVRQNTARVVITMLENLAAEGEITSIEKDENDSWYIKNDRNEVLVRYIKPDESIYTGTTSTPVLQGVTESEVKLDAKRILNISVKTTADEDYQSSIYCRTMRLPDEPDNTEPESVIDEGKKETESKGTEGRLAFLSVLESQYQLKGGSPNPGLILRSEGYSTGMYYSEWYVGGSYIGHDGWGPETPWCACFVSWGLCHDNVRGYVDEWNISTNPEKGIMGGVAFASVDRFLNYFENLGTGHWKLSKARENDATDPIPGDIIFIDWDKGQGTNGYDPAHVGVVLKVEGGYVYTIEGNRDNRVMVCKYALSDPIIMGYGIIDWKS